MSADESYDWKHDEAGASDVTVRFAVFWQCPSSHLTPPLSSPSCRRSVFSRSATSSSVTSWPSSSTSGSSRASSSSSSSPACCIRSGPDRMQHVHLRCDDVRLPFTIKCVMGEILVCVNLSLLYFIFTSF